MKLSQRTELQMQAVAKGCCSRQRFAMGQWSGLIGFQIAIVSLEDFEFKMKRGLQISGINAVDSQ
jgi:hypothetical protein